MSSDFLGGFRCGNGGGMSGLCKCCICWECLLFLPPLLAEPPLDPPEEGGGGEKALPRLVLEMLCERFAAATAASASLSLFFRVPRLNEDRDRGKRERKAGVEWCTGVTATAAAFGVDAFIAFIMWPVLVSIGAKCAD